MYHLNTFHLLKTEGVSQTKDERQHIVSLISLKNSLQNPLRRGCSPAFDNIFTANIYIGNVEQGEGFTIQMCEPS